MSITVDDVDELSLSIQHALAAAQKDGYRAGYVDGMAKSEHLVHVITGRLGGFMGGRSHKKSIAVPQRISSREASAMGRVGGLTAALNATRKAYADYLEEERHDKEDFVTATEIGKLMTPERTGEEMNKIFEAAGWITRPVGGYNNNGRYERNWQLTERGKPYGKPVEYRTAYDQRMTTLHWNKKETLLALKSGAAFDELVVT